MEEGEENTKLGFRRLVDVVRVFADCGAVVDTTVTGVLGELVNELGAVVWLLVEDDPPN